MSRRELARCRLVNIALSIYTIITFPAPHIPPVFLALIAGDTLASSCALLGVAPGFVGRRRQAQRHAIVLLGGLVVATPCLLGWPCALLDVVRRRLACLLHSASTYYHPASHKTDASIASLFSALSFMIANLMQS